MQKQAVANLHFYDNNYNNNNNNDDGGGGDVCLSPCLLLVF